ncbi:MAG: SUMF1/EgtB/PvdO family nonheme iron enzyme [Chlorobaculum sp.]|nr:SUMF1/EgtB/PvdO family nonheme iron enzyme [Chlorobaculum sp.]
MQEKTLRHVKILIASPSDVAAERDMAVEVINEWNIRNRDAHKLELEAVLWESHSAPESGDRVQGILNRQIVDECDFAIAIFWTRIGTHTGEAPGGAVEEAQRLMGDSKQVMFYFSNVPFRKKDVDLEQVAALDQFKESLQKNALVQEYDEQHEFKNKLVHQLDLNLKRWYNLSADTGAIKSSEHQRLLQRYQETLKNHLCEVNLSGSPAIDSFSVRLEDTFVSLRLSETWRSERRFQKGLVDDGMDGARTRNPEEVMSLVFKHHRLLLVIGDPGSGKTTLLKYYALSCMDDGRYKELGFSEPVSVFYMPLRELKRSIDDHEPLPAALSSWCDKRYLNNIAERNITDWLEQASTLVLLDGLDEIGDVQVRIAVCKWIDSTVKRFGNARFVVTSRSTGYRKGDGIEIVTSHVRADIMDFTPEQQALFLHKWFLAAYLRELPPAGTQEAEWREIQEKQAKDKADAIVAYLNQDHNASLRSFAGVPLMIQIMALLWKEREFLPNSRLKLYDAALDYLLDYRDKQKGIYPLLPTEDARRVLCPVSLWMQEKLGKDEADRMAMQQEMQKVLDTISQPLPAHDFCANLVHRAGLLVEYGDDEYVFRHKTFREYLAGVQLVKNVHRTTGFLDNLVSHFGDDWWQEPLRFFIAQLDDAVLFDLFMQKLFDSPVTESMTPKQQSLLLTLIREAPQKKVDAFQQKLMDLDTTKNRQSYLVDCLKAMNREDASMIVGKFVLDRLRERVFINSIELNTEYILIDGGSYKYSETNKEEVVHDFYMAKYPVTNRLYRKFISYLSWGWLGVSNSVPIELFRKALYIASKKGFLKGYSKFRERQDDLTTLFQSEYDEDQRFNSGDQPVVGVTWYAASAYCLWLSLMESNGQNLNLYRLPNEIEWEYAAAGKMQRTYPWGIAEPTLKLTNFGAGEGATTPVGSYPEGATPEGIYDMAGNAMEWMHNCYDKYKDSIALRGGSWSGSENLLSCFSRYSIYPAQKKSYIGFRVMRST